MKVNKASKQKGMPKSGLSIYAVEKEYLKEIFDHLSDGVLLFNSTGQVLSFNQRACDILGWTPGLGTSFPGELRPAMIALKMKEPVRDYPMGFCQPNGTKKWLKVNAVPVRDEVIVTFQDVSEEVRHSQELEKSRSQNIAIESKYKYIFDESPVGILFIDKNRRIVNANAAFANMTGYTIQELEALSTRDLSHPEDLDLTKRMLKDMQKHDKKWAVYEKRFLKKNGETIVFRVHNLLAQEEFADEFAFLGLFEDVTEKKKMEADRLAAEQKLVSESKFSALGQMAGGMAHEINTPLAVIQLRMEGLRKVLDEIPGNQKFLLETVETICKMTERISKIILALRAFAKDGHRDPIQKSSIQEIVRDTLELCSAKMNDQGIKLNVDLSESIEIECRPAEISQVMLNLINNAVDAVQTLKDKWIDIAVKDHGSFIEIGISDSGTGIPSEIREKIMQPFFTTKEIGKGTGLGLSTSKGIAERHGGRLRIDDNCRNTRFILMLPKNQPEAGLSGA